MLFSSAARRTIGLYGVCVYMCVYGRLNDSVKFQRSEVTVPYVTFWVLNCHMNILRKSGF